MKLNRIRTKTSAFLLAALLAIGAIGIGGIDIADDLPLADQAAEAHRNTCLDHIACGALLRSRFNTHRYWQPKFHEYNVFAHVGLHYEWSHKDYVYDPN